MAVEQMENEEVVFSNVSEITEENVGDIDFSNSETINVSGKFGSLGELIDANDPNGINIENLKILLGNDFSQQILTPNTHIEIDGINFYVKTSDNKIIATLSDTNPGVAFSLEFAPQITKKPKPEGRENIIQNFNNTTKKKERVKMFNILKNELGLSLNTVDDKDKNKLIENLSLDSNGSNEVIISEKTENEEGGEMEKGRPLYIIHEGENNILDISSPTVPIVIPFEKG